MTPVIGDAFSITIYSYARFSFAQESSISPSYFHHQTQTLTVTSSIWGLIQPHFPGLPITPQILLVLGWHGPSLPSAHPKPLPKLSSGPATPRPKLLPYSASWSPLPPPGLHSAWGKSNHDPSAVRGSRDLPHMEICPCPLSSFLSPCPLGSPSLMDLFPDFCDLKQNQNGVGEIGQEMCEVGGKGREKQGNPRAGG